MDKVKIHKRAMIDEGVKIGEGTVIGPDVVIEKGAEIGKGCEIKTRAIVTGKVKMGDKNQVGYGAVIGAEPQDLSFERDCDSFVEIGNGNTLREYVTIHRGTKGGSVTRIGNSNYLMVGAHVAHNCILRDHIILVNNVLLAGYVEIRDRAFLGGDVVVHQYTRIGEHAMVRGQTRLGLDVPPYCMAVDTNQVCGINRVGLKRNGFDVLRRRRILSAYEMFYFSGKNRKQAIEALLKMKEEGEEKIHLDIQLFCDFLEDTQRGICRATRKDEG